MTMTESTEVKSSDAGNLQLETWPIGRLVPSPRNARKHSKAQIAEIAGSITAFGFAIRSWPSIPISIPILHTPSICESDPGRSRWRGDRRPWSAYSGKATRKIDGAGHRDL